AIAVGEYAGMSAVFALGGTLLGLCTRQPDAWRWTLLWLAMPLAATTLALFALRDPPRACPLERRGHGCSIVTVWRQQATIVPVLLGLATIELALGAILVWAPTI